MDVREVKDFGLIEREWVGLLEKSATGTVWQHPVWINTWQSHAKTQNLILGVYDGEELVGVGVFEERDGVVIFGAMRSTWVKAYALSDFGDVVAERGREEEVWGALLKYFSIQYTVYSIQLDFVREKSPSFMVLPKAAKELGFEVKIKKQEVSPYIRVPKTWEEYLQSLERKKRHELKRKMRRVEEGGGEIEMVQDWSKEQFDRFVILVKVASAEKREFMNDEMERFFEEMMKGIFMARMGKLFGLRIEERVVAMVLGFEFKKGWYLYNGGFEGENTGIALSGMIIREAIKRGVKLVDFLRGGERYKYDLGAKDQQLYQLTLRQGSGQALRPAVAGSGQALRPAVAGSGQAISN